MKIYVSVLTSFVLGVINATWLYLAFGLTGLVISVPLNIFIGGLLGWFWPQPKFEDPWPKPKLTGDPDKDSLALFFYLKDHGLEDPLERFKICQQVYPRSEPQGERSFQENWAEVRRAVIEENRRTNPGQQICL